MAETEPVGVYGDAEREEFAAERSAVKRSAKQAGDFIEVAEGTEVESPAEGRSIGVIIVFYRSRRSVSGF